METINEVVQSSDLRHRINTVDKEGNPLQIDIRLNDECKNGHADFAITATAWQKGKPKTDRYFIYGGCSHEEILAVMPELKIFVDLHLSTAKGVPMYAIENGFYHLKNSALSVAQEYIRATDQEMELIKQSEDKIYFQCMLEKLGIPERWKQEADKAIQQLEKWTGKKFVDNSTKTGFIPLGEKMAEIEAKIKEGFYSPAKLQERAEQKVRDQKAKKIQELTKDRERTIKTANDEFNVKMAVLNGGLSLENFIYYTHTNEAVFNWNTSSYNKAVTAEEFKRFLGSLNTSGLPRGIKFKLSDK